MSLRSRLTDPAICFPGDIHLHLEVELEEEIHDNGKGEPFYCAKISVGDEPGGHRRFQSRISSEGLRALARMSISMAEELERRTAVDLLR